MEIDTCAKNLIYEYQLPVSHIYKKINLTNLGYNFKTETVKLSCYFFKSFHSGPKNIYGEVAQCSLLCIGKHWLILDWIAAWRRIVFNALAFLRQSARTTVQDWAQKFFEDDFQRHLWPLLFILGCCQAKLPKMVTVNMLIPKRKFCSRVLPHKVVIASSNSSVAVLARVWGRFFSCTCFITDGKRHQQIVSQNTRPLLKSQLRTLFTTTCTALEADFLFPFRPRKTLQNDMTVIG